MKILALALASCALGLAATPAVACSPVRGYRVPTNFELVRRADLVVLGRIRRAPSDTPPVPGGPMSPQVHAFTSAGGGLLVVEPIRALKGQLDGRPLYLGGLTSLPGPNGTSGGVVPSVVTDLAQVHPSAMWGGCVRQAFPDGGLVVVAFERTPVGFRLFGAPFARAAEDVEGPDGLWVRAVEAYAVMQQGVADDQLRARAAERQQQLAARRDDAFAQALAADLQTYLTATGSAP